MKRILMFMFVLLGLVGGVNASTVSHDVQPYYNITNPTIQLTNDWVSTSDISDSLTFTDFISINLTDNSGNIELSKLGFNLSTATHVQFLSVAAQEANPNAVEFNNEGTKMFVLGKAGDDVNEYHCSVGFNVSTCVYDSVFPTTLDDTLPEGLRFNNDGTKMFIVGDAGNDVNEYHCTTGFDVSTCSYNSSGSISAADTLPTDLEFNNDGTKMFILGDAGNDVGEFHCTTGFDVSTCSYNSSSIALVQLVPQGMTFSTDGTKMFITGNTDDDIDEYICSTGFDVSTCTYNTRLYIGGEETNPQGITFNSEGTKMFIVGDTGDEVNEYDLAGDYNIQGTLIKEYTTTKEFNTFTLTDTKVLNGQTINSFLYYNGTEYSLSSPLTQVIPISSTIELRYYFTGTTSITPQLSNISFNGINTDEIPLVEMFYSLNGGIKTSVGNITAYNLTLTYGDGLQQMVFYANDEISETNVSVNFTIDTTAPVIVNNIVSETDSYLILFNSSTCTDANIDTCSISINSQTKDLFTDTNITSTLNGNISYTITATDLAGNTLTENGVVLVNPLQCNNFFVNGVPITNYDFNSITYTSNPACLSTYGDGLILGSNTLLFEKLGYASTNITFTVNTTNELNLSYNITASKIILSIYDRETNALLSGLTTITLIATTGYNSSTTTGLLNISDINFINEQYQIIAEHTGYATETVVFNYNNQELLNVNIYLLNATATQYGAITLKAIADTGELINEATCSALEWQSSVSAYVSVATGLTNVNGETTLNIELGVKNYKFSCTKEGITAISSPQIVQTTGTTLPIILSTAELIPVPSLENLIYSLINTTENATHERITLTWADTDGLVTQGCINVYRVKGLSKTVLSSTCVSSATSQIQILIDVNQTYNTVAYGVVTVNGLDRPLDSIIFPGSQSIETSLKENNLALIIPFLFALIGLVLGFAIKPQNIYMSIIGMFIGLWAGVSIVTDVIPKGTTYFISVMLLLMLWGAYKFK